LFAEYGIWGTKQNLEEEDCQWMLDHWPALQLISDDFNENHDTSEKLEKMMSGLELS